jgi:Ca2+-binding EF-hand superfamily protein
MLGAAGLVSLPIAAQTTPGAAPVAAPAKQTDDDAAEFARLDKNKDGVIDKTEAASEPRLSANFDAADTNKDGKIDKNEWAAFQKNKALVIKK